MTVIDLPTTITEVSSPEIPDTILAQARELDDLRDAVKVLEDRAKTLRASLLDFLNAEGVDSITDGKVSVSRSTHERAGIDRARMEALYPKVLADVSTTTKVEQVRVKVK